MKAFTIYIYIYIYVCVCIYIKQKIKLLKWSLIFCFITKVKKKPITYVLENRTIKLQMNKLRHLFVKTCYSK